jgi:hypothetical protein
MSMLCTRSARGWHGHHKLIRTCCSWAWEPMDEAGRREKQRAGKWSRINPVSSAPGCPMAFNHLDKATPIAMTTSNQLPRELGWRRGRKERSPSWSQRKLAFSNPM